MNGARCRAMNGLTYRKQTASEALNDGCIDCSDRVGGGGGGGGGGGEGECNRLLPSWESSMVVPRYPEVSSLCN